MVHVGYIQASYPVSVEHVFYKVTFEEEAVPHNNMSDLLIVT